ncbi:hypothetical protein [Rickettsia endosymbiont of Oedothorax gibbosus]|nr:hypothetical protein [Rickettsia endosymbiont of Oedothorax gibbosus]
MLTKLLPKNIDRCKVDIWSQDETRVGQQGSLIPIAIINTVCLSSLYT